MFGLSRIERSRRDWIIDLLAVALSILFGLIFRGITEENLDGAGPPDWVWELEAAVGFAFCLALMLRRRWLNALAVLSVPVAAFSLVGGPASAFVLFAVAIHRPMRIALTLAVAQCVASIGVTLLYPTEGDSFWLNLTIAVLVTAGVVAWGMWVRARRQLLRELRERAERAEREQQLMADRAREAERTRIAREMHDVLAHRVTLIALHAGALELNSDQPAPDVERSAALIRSTARLAMEDLRSVIGVLRGVTGANGDAPPSEPQPTLADVPRLVEESRNAGEKVELLMDVPDGMAPPETVGRDAYRIVQEALTNVHKHARGTATTVMLGGAPGEGLSIEVRNRLPLARAATPTVPGAGAGLVGLAERVALSAGTLEHGPAADGDFVVRALLRWPA